MRTTRGRILAVDYDAAMPRTVERILSPAHDVRRGGERLDTLR